MPLTPRLLLQQQVGSHFWAKHVEEWYVELRIASSATLQEPPPFGAPAWTPFPWPIIGRPPEHTHTHHLPVYDCIAFGVGSGDPMACGDPVLRCDPTGFGGPHTMRRPMSCHPPRFGDPSGSGDPKGLGDGSGRPRGPSDLGKRSPRTHIAFRCGPFLLQRVALRRRRRAHHARLHFATPRARSLSQGQALQEAWTIRCGHRRAAIQHRLDVRGRVGRAARVRSMERQRRLLASS